MQREKRSSSPLMRGVGMKASTQFDELKLMMLSCVVLLGACATIALFVVSKMH